MRVSVYGRDIDLGPSPSKQCVRRWMGELSPEPETVTWIESLPSGGVFYDIGANIGRFSIMATLRGLEVYAFEPVAEHYFEFHQIIQRNQLPIRLFPVAVSDMARVGTMGRGRSTHTLLPPMPVQQSVLALTIDQFVVMQELLPEYIKIDVDGDEPLVLRGMANSLRNVSSLLVEVDPTMPGHHAIPKFMEGHGFTYDPAQVNACMIHGGKYDGTANYVFKRR